jgi:hypothetical protein
MTTVYIYSSDRERIAEYCSRTISPKRYYLHNSIGGVGWTVAHTDRGWTCTAPPEHITLVALQYKVIPA